MPPQSDYYDYTDINRFTELSSSPLRVARLHHTIVLYPLSLNLTLTHARTRAHTHAHTHAHAHQRTPKAGYSEGDVIQAVTTEYVEPTIDLLTARVQV